MYKNEIEIDVLRCLRAIAKKYKFIILIMVLFFIIGCGRTISVGEDRYSAVATVYAASDKSYNDASNAVTAMNAYLDVAKSYKVSQRAALIMGRSDIDASDIQNAISVNSALKDDGSSSTIYNFMTSSATIISFVATTNDPDLSMAMADAAAQSYSIEMADILGNDSVKLLDGASSARVSYNANREAWKTRIKYALIGFLLACVVVALGEIFDRKVRTVRDATIKNELPIIGIIPDFKE